MEPINNSNIDERLAALAMNLELLSRDREADKERLVKQGEHIDRLVSASENLLKAVEQDGEHIRTLARIAERHEARLNGIDDRL